MTINESLLGVILKYDLLKMQKAGAYFKIKQLTGARSKDRHHGANSKYLERIMDREEKEKRGIHEEKMEQEQKENNSKKPRARRSREPN